VDHLGLVESSLIFGLLTLAVLVAAVFMVGYVSKKYITSIKLGSVGMNGPPFRQQQ